MAKTSRQLEREVERCLASSATDPMAATLLPPGQNPAIGPESGAPRRQGIGRHTSPHGSVRYLYYDHGTPIAGLQLVTADGRTAKVANVYTTPAHRRRGLAAKLLTRARKDFADVHHAEDIHLSGDGRAWRDKIEGRE